MSNGENLNDTATLEATVGRIMSLEPGLRPRWGTMTVSGMMDHCASVLAVSNGAPMTVPFSRRLILFLARPFLRRVLLGDRPYRRNLPTAPDYVPPPDADFDASRARLLETLEVFRTSDQSADFRHPIFGRFTGRERGRLSWKHLDHHLTQFGV